MTKPSRSLLQKLVGVLGSYSALLSSDQRQVIIIHGDLNISDTTIDVDNTVNDKSVTKTKIVAGIKVNMGDLITDFDKLSMDLFKLAKTNEEYEEAKAIAMAKDAAESDDEKGMLDALKKVGKWTLGRAEAIGTSVATALIKSHLGL